MSGSLLSNKAGDCDSLAQKVAIYCKGAQVSGRAASLELHGLAEYATELRNQGDRNTLAALAREIDVWLREVQTAPEALLLLSQMREGGVCEKHLPILSSAKRLKAISARGQIRTRAEAELVHSVLAHPALARILGDHGRILGAALNEWHVKSSINTAEA